MAWHGLLVSTALILLSAANARALLAYVSNEKSNTVTVIDTEKFEPLRTIKVGQRPRGIELTKDGKFVLVAVGDDDTIQMIDTEPARSPERCRQDPIPSFSRRIRPANSFTS